MRQAITSKHRIDENGNPAGGMTNGTGFAIKWQNGPLGTGESRRSPNGAFVEGLILAVIDRIEFYQTASDGRFACLQNADALSLLSSALSALDDRTAQREARGVEGTHEP
jgi:hypothetical protein